MSRAVAILLLGRQDPETLLSRADWNTIFLLTSFYIIVVGWNEVRF